LLFLIFVAAPAGTGIHEFGHIIGAKSVGADKMLLSIGVGTIVYRSMWKKINITVRAFFFIGGMACSERKIPYRPRERIRIAVLGPLNSFLATGFCYALYAVYPNGYLLLFLLFNLWIAAVNTIPFRFKGKQSDGYTILRIIMQK